MASTAQISANRNNSQKSTGPKSPPGKGSSRTNSLQHGLSAETMEIEAAYPGFAERLAQWEAADPPSTPKGRFALRQAVAATFRLERCESAYRDAAVAREKVVGRGRDEDRTHEAAGALIGRPRAIRN